MVALKNVWSSLHAIVPATLDFFIGAYGGSSNDKESMCNVLPRYVQLRLSPTAIGAFYRFMHSEK